MDKPPPLFFRSQTNLTALQKNLRKTRFNNLQWRCSKQFPAGSTQVPHIRGIRVIYRFFKRSAVSQSKLSIKWCANIFRASYESDALQNNSLKNDRPLCVTFPISYAVDLSREVQDKTFLNPDIRYLIALHRQTNKFLPYHLPLTILFDPSIQVCSGVLVHLILIDTKECINGSCEENTLKVDLAQYAGDWAHICIGIWRRGGQGLRGFY